MLIQSIDFAPLVLLVVGIPFLIPAALGALSFFAGSRKRQGPQTTSTQTSNSSSTSTPTLDPTLRPLQDLIQGTVTRRLANPTGVLAGFADSGVANINRNFQLAGQNSENDLTSRGLGTSPVAGSVMGRLNAGRVGEISRFQNQLPLIGRQMEDNDIDTAMRIISGGRGQSFSSSGTSSGSGNTMVGGGMAGGLDSMADMLGFLIGSGAFGRSGTGARRDPNLGPFFS